MLRRVPALIRFGDALYPSLALATLMKYAKTQQVEVVWREGTGRLDLLVGNRKIPVDAQGNVLVRFSPASNRSDRVSASDILRNEPAPGRFRNKIVLVGVSAAGLESSYLTSAGEIHTPTAIPPPGAGEFVGRPANGENHQISRIRSPHRARAVGRCRPRFADYVMARTIIEKNMGGSLSVCNTGEGAHFKIVV